MLINEIIDKPDNLRLGTSFHNSIFYGYRKLSLATFHMDMWRIMVKSINNINKPCITYTAPMFIKLNFYAAKISKKHETTKGFRAFSLFCEGPYDKVPLASM